MESLQPAASVLVASRDGTYARYLVERLRSIGMKADHWVSPTDEHTAGPDPSRVDVLLLETDGFRDPDWTLVERVRDQAPLVEIIAISSDPNVEEVVEVLRSGVFSVVSYPVSDDQLAEVIVEACRRKRRGEERLKALGGTPHRQGGS
jgi:DNA-binding NtrC family response regulator